MNHHICRKHSSSVIRAFNGVRRKEEGKRGRASSSASSLSVANSLPHCRCNHSHTLIISCRRTNAAANPLPLQQTANNDNTILPIRQIEKRPMILIEKLARCSIRCIPNEMEEERARVKIIRQEGKKNGEDAIVRRVLSLVWTSKLSTDGRGPITVFPQSEEEDRMPVVTHPPPYAPRSYVLNKEPIRRAGA